MMSSSPSPSRSLHQHGNADGDEDQGPESTEPIKTEPAKLVEQEDHSQSDQDDGADGHSRWRVLGRSLLHHLTFDRRRSRHSDGSRSWLSGRSEEVDAVE